MEAPELFVDGYFGTTGSGHFPQGNCYFDMKPIENVNHFPVDDLFDFSKEDEVMTEVIFDNVKRNSTDSSTVTVIDSCNSSVSSGEPQLSGSLVDAQFTGELCVPYDDLAELEWLSNFVEDSFSSDEFQNLQLISPRSALHIATSSSEITPREFQPQTTTSIHTNPTILFPSNIPVPGKARSKRSRASPCDWSSRLLLLSPSAEHIKQTQSNNMDPTETPGRKCLHCYSEKTPQWRTGPMGPKTLCNACGVRFKSGRLVPEYRPAASPTFVLAKHSNSHRKVLELRRQKELEFQIAQQQQQQFISQCSIFETSNGGDYLIHHPSGPDYGHMI